MDINQLIERLKYLCAVIPPLLENVDEDVFSSKPLPDKWSKKEILGHLIDSATNNHQRFIRIQYQNEPTIFYDQNKWNTLNNYNNLSKKHLIQLWLIYNEHLIEILKIIPEQNLDLLGRTHDRQKHSLQFYIDDYISHLEHHLTQLVSY